MRKIFLIALLLLTFQGISMAQNKAENGGADFGKAYQTYFRAMRYNDMQVAKNAIYDMLAANPQAVNWLDSLAAIYFEFEQYPSSLLVSKDLLRINSEDMNAVRIAAVSYEKLGLYSQAVSQYENLFLQTDDVNILYRIATLQFQLDRNNEALTNCDLLLTKEAVKQNKMVFPLTDKKNQQVSMLAAVYNLKGMVLAEQKKKDEAKAAYQKALEIAPDFQVAKDNLSKLK